MECLPWYVMFRIGLGMLETRRIDDVWDSESMHTMHTWRKFSRAAGPFMCCSGWRILMRMHSLNCACCIGKADGNFVALCAVMKQWCRTKGCLTVIRHNVIRHFIPCKPHSTGVKLYALCDAQSHYIWHVYL